MHYSRPKNRPNFQDYSLNTFFCSCYLHSKLSKNGAHNGDTSAMIERGALGHPLILTTITAKIQKE